ncbi:YebG family protein [Simiduia agarivorans]|uniref:DNA damage-inducible gene in SOS regulon, dependent on cyclic AMP and H-NS n=1 Tax=Simiduia agarivorans (strain DSM 21679 / JCM 13881 / BCRC 17597 / SA1) TaxID=1117647 RepID=K4KVM2_SIMAS|nr:YebG family protein [Simiduia agarivorans]AFU97997.1 DNA damage-inducible gene in SOS regulon, dependent on cyclic AMP and H-NS [Simiduia agarivorans SA1 = DSM 21679]
MAIEIVYRVIKRNGEQAGEYMDKKLADAHDQRLDCVYTIVDLISDVETGLGEDKVEMIAEKLIDNRQDLMAALKKVKDLPTPAEDENVTPISAVG